MLCPLSYGGRLREETVEVLRAGNGWAARVAAVVGTIVALGVVPSVSAGSSCVVPGYGERLNALWKPDMRAAIDYARTPARGHRICGPDRPSLLRLPPRARRVVGERREGDAARRVPRYRPSVAHRPLNGYDGSLLPRPMIEFSDNNAASTVVGIVGDSGLWALAHRVGMKHFGTDPVWGKTRITADDQTKFLYNIDRYVVARHRAFAMHLLASVTPSQRWGIGEIPPAHWNLYFKGGWGSGTGLLDHQVVLLTRGCTRRTSLAVLSMYEAGPISTARTRCAGSSRASCADSPTAKELAWRVSSRGGDTPSRTP